MGARISDIEYFLPDFVLGNDDLIKEFPEWDAAKIEDKVGIKSRHIAGKDETSADLAFKAAEQLFLKIDRTTIDFLILCTQSPDYFLPTTACILQDRLKLRTDIGAFDFNLGCSGFVYGLGIAKSIIGSKIASRVLLITSETYSKHIHKTDKVNRSIFGDAAAATLVDEVSKEYIHDFIFGTDGRGMNNLIVKAGGIKDNLYQENSRKENCLFMDGPEIFNFTLDVIPDLVYNTLKKNNVNIQDIDFFLFHQANKFMLEYLRKKLEIDPAKFYINMLETGNTVSATIPIALKDCLGKRIIKSGDKVLLAGFGVGYSWGATIITI